MVERDGTAAAREGLYVLIMTLTDSVICKLMKPLISWPTVKTVSFEKTDIKHPLPLLLMDESIEQVSQDKTLHMSNLGNIGMKNAVSYVKYLLRTAVSRDNPVRKWGSTRLYRCNLLLIGHSISLWTFHPQNCPAAMCHHPFCRFATLTTCERSSHPYLVSDQPVQQTVGVCSTQAEEQCRSRKKRKPPDRGETETLLLEILVTDTQ